MSELPRTLLVRHLPAELEAADQESLLKHFGAAYVRGMGNKGRMKNMAFATFATHDEAAIVMRRLHQLDVLGSRLIVEYSTKKYEDFHPTELNPATRLLSATDSGKESIEATPDKRNAVETEKDRRQKIIDKMHATSARWHIDYPLDPRLQYLYPSPTVTILTNIANAMAAVPRFYVQVLHLMNKMNLPAPFGLPTLTPPVPLGTRPPQPADVPAPPMPESIDYSSSSESEMESSSEDEKAKQLNVDIACGKRVRRRERRYASRKRLRLQIQMQSQMQSITGASAAQRPPGSVAQPSEMFEQSMVTSKKIEIKKISDEAAKSDTMVAVANTLEECNTNAANKTVETSVNIVEGGFGKIQPPVIDKVPDDVEADEDWQKQGFISIEDLQKGQLSEKEMQELDIFKNYCPGEPTSRLYIKNLAKKVTEKDLGYIYGRYINWENESEKAMFYVQVLTGRMKGQAFITLPNEIKAKEALDDTNGYQIHGKPLVVQFARSVKPKDKTVANSGL